MIIETNIFGCFVNSSSANWDDDQKTLDKAKEQGDLFCSYIWGEKGICNTLKKLNHSDYGKDVILILFQFYVNPIPYLRANLREIENYRPKEKSIGIPVIVDDDNFFNLSEPDRFKFFQHTLLNKLDLLKEKVKRNKLDLDLIKLKSDLNRLLGDFCDE